MRVQEAVSAAGGHLSDVFPDAAGCELRLEGAEKSDDEKYWWITFSYSRREGNGEALYREYRTVKLRNADGAFMGARNGTFLPDVV